MRPVVRERIVVVVLSFALANIVAFVLSLALDFFAERASDQQFVGIFRSGVTWLFLTAILSITVLQVIFRKWGEEIRQLAWPSRSARVAYSADHSDEVEEYEPIEPIAPVDIGSPAAGGSVEVIALARPNRLGLKRLNKTLTALAHRPEPDIVTIIDTAISQAIALHASDVHFEPSSSDLKIRFRVDGTLLEVARLPILLHGSLVNRLKVMSNLPTFERGTPQDGRVFAKISGRQFDIRISFMPTIFAEKVVLRLLESNRNRYNLDDLGFTPKLGRRYREILSRPQGIVYVTGPTGSGKTTTLYASLLHIKHNSQDMVNIVTIEDPVETAMPEFSQTQVREDVGLTFAKGLRTILRQDPDVIMLGEIRDGETAEVALQAGLTGHLMLTTVHADSTAGVFSRLINMGIEPFLLASSSAAVLSQRLVRRLCPDCSVKAALSDGERCFLQEAGLDLGYDATFYTGRGCDQCLDSGYRGRTLITELMPVTEDLRESIINKVSASELTRLAVDGGMQSMLDAGIAKALTGATSVAEILRVTR